MKANEIMKYKDNEYKQRYFPLISCKLFLKKEKNHS